jgi:hypothetical protein
MARQGRVQELAGKKPAGICEHGKRDAELATLGLVDGQAVGKLKWIAAFIAEPFRESFASEVLRKQFNPLRLVGCAVDPPAFWPGP